MKVTASQLHYGLATVFTVEAMIRFWIDKHLDTQTALFLPAFWATALANDKYNTPTPT